MRAALSMLLWAGLSWAEVLLTGRVTADGTAVAGARVALQGGQETMSDLSGEFRLAARDPGVYGLSVERDGYFPIRGRSVTLADGVNQITLEIIVLGERLESVDVRDRLIETTPSKELTGEQLLSAPVPGDYNLRNVLRVLPGVVQDRRGRVHVDGGADDQLHYTLDGFTVNDPITSRFDGQASIESMRSVDLYSGRFSAEYGKGSAGTLAIRTHTGEDRPRFSVTNFLPVLDYRKDVSIGSWLPRVTVSGPLVKGRAWISNSSDAQYEQYVIKEIRQGPDRSHTWRLSNLTHAHVNLSPSNVLHLGLLGSWLDAPRQGLSYLDPPETTLNRRARQWFFHFKDQVYFSQGAIVEIGYAGNRTWQRETPQGSLPFIVAPGGRMGNHFLTAARSGQRDQFLLNLLLPAFTWLGSHQIKAGMGVDRLAYTQDVHRTAVEFRRFDGGLLRRVAYAGDGDARQWNREWFGYVQDTWRLRPSLTAELGLREDADRLAGRPNVSPRVGLAWSPFRSAATKLAGGFGVVHDASPLRLFTRPLDQSAVTTYYGPAGEVARGPVASVYTFGTVPLRSPRYVSWSAGIEQRLPARMVGSIHYLRKRTQSGFTYRNRITGQDPEAQTHDGIFELTNDRHDEYDAMEIKLRRSFRRYDWSASYTRSRAYSNAAVDLNVDDPLLIDRNVGPMPWHAPHRFVTAGLLPAPVKDWSIVYLAEYRSGLPFSVQDAEGRLFGAVNGYRFPAFVECNLHLERNFSLGGRRWAARFGFHNILGRYNPVIADNNMGSPRFLSYYGSQGRVFTVRLRWVSAQ